MSSCDILQESEWVGTWELLTVITMDVHKRETIRMV